MTRQRQVVGGVLLPFFVVGVAVMTRGPWWLLLIAAPASTALAVRAYRAGLSLDGDRVVVRSMFSTLSVPVSVIAHVSFREGGNPHVPQPLLLDTTDGQRLTVRAISHTRRLLELPSDGKTKGERRVDEFLKHAGLTVTVERPADG